MSTLTTDRNPQYIWIFHSSLFVLHLEFTPGGLSAPRGRRAEGRLRGFQPWCSIRAAGA